MDSGAIPRDARPDSSPDSATERAGEESRGNIVGLDPGLFRVLESTLASGKEAERFARSIIESLSALVAVVDESGTIIATNPAWHDFARANGASASEVGDGVNYLAVCDRAGRESGDQAAIFAAGMRDVIAGRRPCHTQSNACHSPTKRRWFECRVTALIGHARPWAVVIHEDVTERKNAEEALRSREGALRAMVDAIPQMIWIADAEGSTTYVNRQFVQYTGVDNDEAKRWGWQKLLDPAELQRCSERWNHSVATGADYEVESRFRMADGSFRWHVVRGGPERDGAGRTFRWFGTCTDIEGLRCAEGEVGRLNESLKDRLQQTEALSRIDEAITSNRGQAQIMGVVVEQACRALGVEVTDVLRLDSQAGTLVSLLAGSRAGLPERRVGQRLDECLAGQVVLKDNAVHIPDLRHPACPGRDSPGFAAAGYVSYHAMPLRVKGRVEGVIELLSRASLAPDADWFSFAEAVARRAAVAIEHASLRESESLAHSELSSAYDATIEGWARALDLRDKETAGHSRRVAEMTVRVARAMGVGEAEQVHVRRGALLHDIGKMGVPDGILLKPGPLNVDEEAVIRRHPALAMGLLWPIEFLRPALDIPHYHHEKWDGTGYPDRLKGDAIPLTARIFAAVDVFDALSNDRPYRRAWRPEQVREHIRSIAGTHLDPDVVEHLLIQIETLHRLARAATNSAASGAESRAHVVSADRHDKPAALLQRLKILLVEDETGTTYSLGRMLEAMGHEVLEAADGLEAWELFERGGVRLVISDWSLAGLDGPSLARRIRSLAGKQYTYILMVAGRSGSEERRKGLAAGADDFLVKPIDMVELEERIVIARRMLSVQDDLLDRTMKSESMQADLRRQNELLSETAIRDPLTGLYNRRYLMECMEDELSQSTRRDEPLSAVLVNLDEFKSYNDDFGDQAGDQLLVRLGQLMRADVRSHDIVARLGGDEFVLLLPNVDATLALALTERLRAAVADDPWGRRPVTISVGVATCPPALHGETNLIEAAEQALFRSRLSGEARLTEDHDAHRSTETGIDSEWAKSVAGL